MISIVIPTFNEEKYLPKLLDSIKKQTFKDYATFFDWKSRESVVSALKTYKKMDLSKPRDQLYKITKHSFDQLLIQPEIKDKNLAD